MPEARGASSRRSPVQSASAAPTPPSGGAILHIGDLAVRSGVSADALRYYERRGLLRPSGRRASGYREYSPEAVDLVHFIKHAQALGFTLAEVEELLPLRLRSARREIGLEVREVAAAKIRDIDEKLRMLAALRDTLVELVAECDHTCGTDAGPEETLGCPIIVALDAREGTPGVRQLSTRTGGSTARSPGS